MREKIEEELKRTEKSLEIIKKALLSGSNQKKLSAAESRLSEKRTELKKKYDGDVERNERRKEKIRLRISQLEGMAALLRERIALLDEEYERLREISRDTADRIVELESGKLCSGETGKELNTRLKAVNDAVRNIKKETRDMKRELSVVEEDISQQKDELEGLEKYRPLPIEADTEYIRLEKELAFRTARRDYLTEMYSQRLKDLDELNCQLYSLSLESRRNARLKDMA